jgi:HlyD family secretion protein
VALAAAAIGVAGWLAAPRTTIRYVTAKVARGAIVRTVAATGTVNPRLTVTVGSYVSGVVQSIDCDFNTEVRKGQLCARIDPRPYRTIVDQVRAELGTALAQLNKDAAALTYAQASLRRSRHLLADGYVSQDAVDNAQAAEAAARAQVELDRAAIRQRQASLTAAEVNLGYTDIVSPVDGTVVLRNVTVGQTVAASFQTPTLFLIATDLASMQVDTSVSESDIGQVKPGDAASFTVEAFPQRVFRGSVTQVRQAPQTVQNVVTYDVIVYVDNADLALKPGMTATTRIVTELRDDVVYVPDQALRFHPSTAGTQADAAPAGSSRRQVWVLHDGRPQPVAVTIGLDDDTNAELTGGELKPGDAVIVGEQRNSSGNGGGSQAGTRPPRFGL